jgi:hypothetical protein
MTNIPICVFLPLWVFGFDVVTSHWSTQQYCTDNLYIFISVVGQQRVPQPAVVGKHALATYLLYVTPN